MIGIRGGKFGDYFLCQLNQSIGLAISKWDCAAYFKKEGIVMFDEFFEHLNAFCDGILESAGITAEMKKQWKAESSIVMFNFCGNLFNFYPREAKKADFSVEQSDTGYQIVINNIAFETVLGALARADLLHTVEEVKFWAGNEITIELENLSIQIDN